MLRGTVYLTIRQVVFVITTLIMHAYLGRRLGPELYGIFGVISAFLIINDSLFLKAVNETISKFIAEREGAAKGIINSALKLQTIMGILTGSICFLFAKQIAFMLNDEELAVYFKLCAFIMPVSGLSVVFIGALNGLRKFGRLALVSIVFSFIRLAAVFIPLVWGFSVKGVIVGLILAELCQLLMGRKLCKPVNSALDFDGKKMFRFGLELIGVGVIASLVMNIDLFAVKIILKDNMLTGLYTSAVTISKIGFFFVLPISITLLPLISKSIAEKDMVLTEKYIKQSMRLLMIYCLPISLICIATSEKLLFLFYGSQYLEASAALKILIFSAVLLSVKILLSNVIVAGGLPRFIIYTGLLSLTIDIVLLATLVDKLGLIGAALASTVTHFVGLVFAYYYVAKKYMNQMIPAFLVRIGLASLIVYIIATVYSPAGLALIGFYIGLLILFFVLLIVLKEIDIETIRIKSREIRTMFNPIFRRS